MALREKNDAWEEAVEERFAATAEVNYRDTMVDSAVVALARDVNVLVHGKTGDPRDLKLFPTPPSSKTGDDTDTR